MKKTSVFTSIILWLAVSSLNAQQESYSRITIFTGESGMRQLGAMGLDVEHGQFKPGYSMTSDFSKSEIQKIAQSGLSYRVEIPDVVKWLEEQNSGRGEGSGARAPGCSSGKVYNTPAHFTLGSMGGFLTYAEMLAHLDTMAADFPNLISVRQSFTTDSSVEGRPIWWVKISDNPSTDETEPEMLYTALHHAREPGSLSQLIFYMYYLLENYGTRY